ncbi:hypothetical protein GF366_04860 [Candidatus Peregrinibacteria bacterium]|nr:hypothetical protein [Candidatus Peregrinibacteria bacterium]
MKKILSIFLSVIVLTFLTTTTAGALTIEAAENIVITESILDDAYIFGGNANIEADIFGDLYIAGGIVVINGNIEEDLVVAGGRVTVMGEVRGDLRVAGGEVSIYGNVGDDIVAAGGMVTIGNGSVVGGTLLAGSGILTINGTITEDVRGGMGMLLLNGIVGRDVIVTIEDTINISEKAEIKGDLNYSAIIEASIPEDVVKGEILFNKFEKKEILKDVTLVFFIFKLISLLAAVLLALIFVLFMPMTVIRSGTLARQNILRSFGIGLLTIISTFIGSILLMVTVIGIPLALIVLALLLIAFYVSKIFVSAWLASYILDFKKKVSKSKLFGGLLLALLIYYLVGIIPFIGWLLNIILFLIGIGIIVLIKKENYLFMKSKKKV